MEGRDGSLCGREGGGVCVEKEGKMEGREGSLCGREGMDGADFCEEIRIEGLDWTDGGEFV